MKQDQPVINYRIRLFLHLILDMRMGVQHLNQIQRIVVLKCVDPFVTRTRAASHSCITTKVIWKGRVTFCH